MAYNVVYTADGLVKCVSDEYLEHKYDQFEAINRKKKRERTESAIRRGKNLRKWKSAKNQSEIDAYQKERDASSNVKSMSRTTGIRNSEMDAYQKTRDTSAKAKKYFQDAGIAKENARQIKEAAAAKEKRRRLKIDATGLKAASEVAVKYMDQNYWYRGKGPLVSDGLDKMIFMKTINGKTKAFEIPIKVYEDRLVERAEKTGFSISKYADTIRSRLKEAKHLDKLFPDARSKYYLEEQEEDLKHLRESRKKNAHLL